MVADTFRPCTAGCGRITRPWKMNGVQSPPDVFRRFAGGRCKFCVDAMIPSKDDSAATVQTRATLEAYMLRRRAREEGQIRKILAKRNP